MDSALHITSEALQFAKNDANLNLLHAIALRYHFRLYEAIGYLKRVEELGATKESSLWLEYMYNYYTLRMYQECREKANLYITANPDLPKGYYYRGLSYMDDYPHKNESAYHDFAKAVKLDPSQSEYFSKRAFCAFKIDRPLQEVVDDFNKAIQLDSTVFFNWYWLYYVTYNKQKQFSKGHSLARECLAYYQRQIRLYPTEAFFYRSASECLEMSSWSYIKAPPKSLKVHYMRKCVEHDTTNQEYYFDIGLYYYRNKMYDSCIWSMENANRCRDWTVYWNYMGLSYEKMGDLKKAEAVFTESIERHPKNSLAYQNRAYFYQRTKQYAKYRADIKMRDSL